MSIKIVECKDLNLYYGKFWVLKHINFEMELGGILGIIGESGSGKSSLVRSLVGLESFYGLVKIGGQQMFYGARQSKYLVSQVQLIFQNALGSFNPMLSIETSMLEPLNKLEKGLCFEQKIAKIMDVLDLVLMPRDSLNRHPHEFSGGQIQRLAIARALLVKPKLLICDESVSALDLSIQGQIINLLLDLKKRLNLSIIFVSHNLHLIRSISERVLVIYRGQIVEQGNREVFSNPQSDYTKKLFNHIFYI